MELKLEDLLRDPDVEDVVLKPKGLFHYSKGQWSGPHPSADHGAAALQLLSRQIAEQAACTLGLTQPSVDAFLQGPDGLCFRAHVAIAPLILEGPEVTLRRLPELNRFELSDFHCPPEWQERLVRAVHEGESILIAGSTGSGKTTLLTALMNSIPKHLRILILEDSPELPLPGPLSSKLLSRSNRFGFRAGASWDLSHLVYESLRMRPDRLILGECRGPEALGIAQALQSGHSGVMTTLHAPSAHGALERFQALALKQSGDTQSDYQRLWDLVLHIEQDAARGVRVLRELLEVKNETR